MHQDVMLKVLGIPPLYRCKGQASFQRHRFQGEVLASSKKFRQLRSTWSSASSLRVRFLLAGAGVMSILSSVFSHEHGTSQLVMIVGGHWIHRRPVLKGRVPAGDTVPAARKMQGLSSERGLKRRAQDGSSLRSGRGCEDAALAHLPSEAMVEVCVPPE